MSVTAPVLSILNSTHILCLPLIFKVSAIFVLNFLLTNFEISFVKHAFDVSFSKPSQPGKIGASSRILKSIISSESGVNVSSPGKLLICSSIVGSSVSLGCKVCCF